MTKLYTKINLDSTRIRSRRSYLKANARGEFSIISKQINKKFSSNYLKYIERVNGIMGGNLIVKQLRNHQRILQKALKRHFFDKIEKEK